MAVPFINFLAPSMGGIGPIELSDFTRLQLLKEKSGVPFYAGRFYPKNNKGIIEDLLDGLWQSNTPPWLTWEEIEPTQIWMVPAFEDERIVTTQTSIERIDVWPRLPDDDLPEWENTMRDDIAQERGWGKISLPGIAGNGQSIEPGITIANNFIPPPLFAGYLGISQISGYVSEYAFYDQELHIMNSKRFGQPQYEQIALSYDRDPETYLELIRIREDGAWINRNAELPTGDFSMDEDNEDGYPIDSNWSNNEYPSTDYAAWVTSPDTLD
jgi:hypothetical protein